MAAWVVRPDQIQTLIFMDFETTGLIKQNHDSSRPVPGDKNRKIAHGFSKNLRIHDVPSEMPHITEMCFLSVPRQLFSVAAESVKNERSPDNDEPIVKKLPSNMITCQVLPNINDHKWLLYEEERKSCSALHLSQEDLRYKNSFSQEWPIVHKFLENQRKPACIIAHNGAHFDFRILYAELKRNNLLEKYAIPDGIFFLDSYLTFLDLERDFFDVLATTTCNLDWAKMHDIFSRAQASATKRNVQPNPPIADDPDVSEVVRDTLDDWTNWSPPPAASIAYKIVDTEEGPAADASLKALPAGLRTPPQNRKRAATNDDDALTKRGRKLFEDDSEMLPMSFMNTSKWSPAKRRRTVKNLFRRVDGVGWEFSEIRAREHFFNGNFKLENLYKQLIKGSYAAHHASDDCEALLQVCLAYGDDFLTYMDVRSERLLELNNLPAPASPTKRV